MGGDATDHRLQGWHAVTIAVRAMGLTSIGVAKIDG
jgi:hypothetical protein